MADPIAATNENNGAAPRKTPAAVYAWSPIPDLQQLVSALWRSGAEAISINDERLKHRHPFVRRAARF